MRFCFLKHWATKIKLVLHEHSLGFVWISDGVGDSPQFLKIFRNSFIDCSFQVLQQTKGDSSKANYYKNILQKYIQQLICRLTIILNYQISDAQTIS